MLQILVRHQFVCKMLAEILWDMTICKREGWDEMEFIRQLQTELDRLGKNPPHVNGTQEDFTRQLEAELNKIGKDTNGSC